MSETVQQSKAKFSDSSYLLLLDEWNLFFWLLTYFCTEACGMYGVLHSSVSSNTG